MTVQTDDVDIRDIAASYPSGDIAASCPPGGKHIHFADAIDVHVFEVDTDMIPIGLGHINLRRARFSCVTEVQTFEVHTDMKPTQELFDDMTVQTDDVDIRDIAASYPSGDIAASCPPGGKHIHFADAIDVHVFEVDTDMIPIGCLCNDEEGCSHAMPQQPPLSPAKTIIQDISYLLAELVDPNCFQQDKLSGLKGDRGPAGMPKSSDFNCAPDLSYYLHEEVVDDQHSVAKFSYEANLKDAARKLSDYNFNTLRDITVPSLVSCEMNDAAMQGDCAMDAETSYYI